MTNKFEQLIEFVINDEEDKAKELFHDIVVEKSREIYENLMNEEEEDDAEEDSEEDSEEDLDEGQGSIGGDASDDLIDDVETEEQGIQMEDDAEFDDEAEEDGEDLTHDMEKDHDEGNETEHDIEDRVIDLEDKLDELMAEFESLMGGDDSGEHSDLGGEEGDELGGDALEMDDTEAFAPEMMEENVKLDAAPKPVTTEPAGTNTKGVVAFNSGAKGMEGAPVKMTGDTAQGRPAPKSGDLPEAGKFKNVPGKGGANSKLAAAPKPVTAQASGVNTKTPFPKG
jgi:hypothetical protein